MKYLIVGLGNIGEEYANTRHNIGFTILNAFAEESKTFFSDRRYGSVCEIKYKGRSFVLLKPSTFMNLSGQAVSRLLAYFKLTPKDLVVMHDDLDVPPWRLKLVERGGPGGHRGILDIIATLHTEEFLRVKLGIGRPPPRMPTEKYVLSPFPAEDVENVAVLIERAAQAVVTVLTEGLAVAQNRFHGEVGTEVNSNK